MIIKKLFLVLFLFLSILGFSQDSNYVVGNDISIKRSQPVFAGVEISLHAATPIGEFEENYSKNSIEGISLGFMFSIPKTNRLLHGGIEIGYFYMSQSSEKYRNLYDDELGYYHLNTKLRGRMIPFHFHLRFVPFFNTKSKLQPFLDGFAGARIFGATQVFEITTEDGEVFDPDYIYDFSSIYSFGYGLGLMYRTNNNVNFILRGNKIFGTDVGLMDPSTVRPNNNQEFNYDKIRSKVELMSITLGVNFNF